MVRRASLVLLVSFCCQGLSAAEKAQTISWRTDLKTAHAEMRSVCRTEAAFRAAQFRAQYTPTAEVLA